jgi:hypothetical protein
VWPHDRAEDHRARWRFAIAGDREVCSKGKGSLAKQGGRRVVHRHQHTALVGSGYERRQITHIQSRIAGCFQPEERCPVQVLKLRISCSWRQTNLDTSRSKKAFCQHARRVIAIRWHEQDTARMKRAAKNGRHGSHARGKKDDGSSFQFTERLLKMGPGRIVVAAIAVG